MNLARLFFALCACFFVLSASAFSQTGNVDLSDPLAPAAEPPRIYIGPIAGFNQNYHTGERVTFVPEGEGVTCPVFGTGDATGYYVGLSAEYLIGNVKDARSSIIARLAYDVRPAQFHQGGDEDVPSRLPLPDGRDTIILSSTEHTAEIKYSMINLDLLYKYMIGNTRIAVTAGPSIGYVLTGTDDQRYNIVRPLDVQFEPTDLPPGMRYDNFGRTIVVHEGDIEELSSIRLGIKVGVQYEISVRKFMVVPAIWYDFGITKVTPNENWRVNALQAGVDIRYALGLF